MTVVTATPPALRWVALFLAACAALGLFLGFRDQIRKNPPGWYTGAERTAAPPPSTPDGARDAVPLDPDAPQPTVTMTTEPATRTPAAKADDEDLEAPVGSRTPAPKAAPPVLTPAPSPAPKARPASPPAPKPAPSADPVGDILESQKPPEPAAVPY
ncbi:MAG: hypothetical protein Q8L23_07745 [Caulobacter sp.]|nr:hypothetical protein [Caulobacter sp.]